MNAANKKNSKKGVGNSDATTQSEPAFQCVMRFGEIEDRCTTLDQKQIE